MKILYPHILREITADLPIFYKVLLERVAVGHQPFRLPLELDGQSSVLQQLQTHLGFLPDALQAWRDIRKPQVKSALLQQYVKEYNLSEQTIMSLHVQLQMKQIGTKNIEMVDGRFAIKSIASVQNSVPIREGNITDEEESLYLSDEEFIHDDDVDADEVEEQIPIV